ncbi:isochorismatase family cysteine hydrolase [Niallia sp. NCCP-28]|uniref:isochorismatase family cysteine hydrolase n=1 Tax=Niallia sp. NCCP-28 TaxID=2934712 RepID=UPI00207E8AAA|nr:isochorismatase family cysteine hydrolase [Niallia sp. NCCP-28]GKU85285.1 putative isochorismatase family protein YaaI [Niallia sp. NCCP-28]
MNTSKNTAMLVIDMINDFKFAHGKTLAEKADKMLDSILSLKQNCVDKKIPIIYINDHYNLWKADIESILNYCHNETSSQLLDKIKPTKTDYFLIKPKHSAFYGTALDTLLQQLNVDTLILTGIAGNICVLFTANDAYMREYSLLVPENCIASVDDEDNKYAMTMMKNVMNAKLYTYEKDLS